MKCTIECDCKIAKHEHGTRNMYIIHKCRGAACREATRVYESKRRRARAYGIPADRVDAQPVREHIELLRVNGVSYKALGKASGVAHSAINAILHGRKERGHAPYARVLSSTAEKILAVKPTMDNMSAGRPIDATGTHRRIQALVAIGYSQNYLAGRLGIQRSNMSQTMTREQVTVRTARLARALYAELWNKPNHPTVWHERSAATRARNHAKAHGWLPPMAWDDDLIDDPKHFPVLEFRGSKWDAKREGFLYEAEFFADAGLSLADFSEKLSVSGDALIQRFERYGRLDLLDQFRRNLVAREAA